MTATKAPSCPALNDAYVLAANLCWTLGEIQQHAQDGTTDAPSLAEVLELTERSKALLMQMKGEAA